MINSVGRAGTDEVCIDRTLVSSTLLHNRPSWEIDTLAPGHLDTIKRGTQVLTHVLLLYRCSAPFENVKVRRLSKYTCMKPALSMMSCRHVVEYTSCTNQGREYAFLQ